LRFYLFLPASVFVYVLSKVSFPRWSCICFFASPRLLILFIIEAVICA
jgi:hypothetical protein